MTYLQTVVLVNLASVSVHWLLAWGAWRIEAKDPDAMWRYGLSVFATCAALGSTGMGIFLVAQVLLR